MASADAGQVAEKLREIAAYLRLVGDNPWKARAYETAAGAVDALGPRLGELLESGRLTEAPGIGPATAAVIAEIHHTGTANRLEALHADMPPGLLELADLPGLTLRRIRALHAGLGIRDRAELHAAVEQGRLRMVKGFGPQSEDKIREALARPPPPRTPTRTRLVDAREATAALLQGLAMAPGVTRAEPAGAVRRWKETVGTIRLVAAAEAPERALDAFTRTRLPAAERVAGAARGRLPDGQAVEVAVVRPALFATAWVRHTAAPAHLERLEVLAAARGLDLAALEAPDEDAVYARLGLPRIPPELREDADSIAAALAGDDFADLVEIADIQGMVHCHTTHSDGRASIEQMARAAMAMGMGYLTITDHSPTASYAGGLTPERLTAQWEEIAAVQRQVDIVLLRGTESDIAADGALDYADDVLASLDVIIASIHNRLRLDEAQMTERLVRAMRLPLFKIWGHPLGRLVLKRDPIACRLEEVLDAMALAPAAVEINGDPYRLDLPPEHVRSARRRGLRFVISTDAHSVRNLENLEYGVAMARRAGVRRGEVLNTLPAAEFRRAVRPARDPAGAGTARAIR
jgi:DNA polymerase (family X)